VRGFRHAGSKVAFVWRLYSAAAIRRRDCRAWLSPRGEQG